jgi:hypothetical protein
MDDPQIHGEIDRLVAEEHGLFRPPGVVERYEQ